MPDLDDDTLDGCELDFKPHADDELTASLRALFPEGIPHNEWDGVFFPQAEVPHGA